MEPYLQMRDITKTYLPSQAPANDDVSMEVERGEIHALVGENGAGKSTLMKILYGLERADSGTIWLGGAKIAIKNPFVAKAHGIGMVHQHFKLIKEFTVAQNVVLGKEPKRGMLLFDNPRAEREAAAVIEQNDFHIAPGKKISELSFGQRQQVEIVKMLYRKAEILILDEPTSVLTKQEIQRFFITLRGLVSQGKTIIFITHKLGEVKEISDRITVMRRGRVVAVKTAGEIDEREISKLMVGHPVVHNSFRKGGGGLDPVFILKGISVIRKGQKRPLLSGVNLEVSSGEIVGVTGAAGNGLAELEDVISGLMPISNGRMYHRDRDITGLSAPELRTLGFAYAPTDRLGRGASLKSTIRENMIVTNHHNYTGGGGIIDTKRVTGQVRGLIEKYQIDGDDRVPIGQLSGGNIQKVILARELERGGDFILFAEPTWGLNVAGGEFIYERIWEVRQRGAAVILISSNIDEVLALADRVLVMYRGRVVMDRRVPPQPSRGFIGEYMIGLKDDFPTEKDAAPEGRGEGEK